jgi:fatty acid desaturase
MPSEGFFRRWKNGIMAATPLQLLRIQRNSQAGQCVGLIIVIAAIAWTRMLFWLVFLVFLLITTMVELVRLHQRVCDLEQFEGEKDGVRRD